MKSGYSRSDFRQRAQLHYFEENFLNFGLESLGVKGMEPARLSPKQ